MVNRSDINLSSPQNNKSVEKDAVSVKYTAGHFPSSKTAAGKDAPRVDDLIVTLANAYENRRARQVTEWERLREGNRPLAI